MLNLYLSADGSTTKYINILSNKKLLKDKVNILFSYYYLFKDFSLEDIQLLKTKKCVNNLFLDSGAYSAYTQSVNIDLDEYIKFINEYGELFKYVSQLDVIGDGKRTLENYKYMKNKIKYKNKLLPIYQYNTNIKYFKKLTEYNECDIIGIGGIADKSHKKRKRLLSKVINYNNCKLHLFGVTDFKLLNNFKKYIYSFDSTSYILKGVMGKIGVFVGTEKLQEVIISDRQLNNKKHFKFYNKKFKDIILKIYILIMKY